MGFILLVAIFFAVISIVCIFRWTGVLPEGLILPSKGSFKFPRLKRTSSGWIAELPEERLEESLEEPFEKIVESKFPKNLYD